MLDTLNHAAQSRSSNPYLRQMTMIFAASFYAHWLIYWWVVGDNQAEGPLGYFYRLQLILFFGHVPVTTLFSFLVIVVFGLPVIPFICAMAPDSKPGTHSRWAGFVVAIPLVLSTLAAYGIEALVEWRDQVAPVQIVDLDADPRTVLHSRFITLSGWMEPKYAAEYSYTTSGRRRDYDHLHVYIPLVEQGWTPAMPIRYFLHTDSRQEYAPRAKTTETAEVSAGLPLYIRWQLHTKKLIIDPSYAVIEYVQYNGSDRVDPKKRYIILGAGLFCSLLASIFVCIHYAARARSHG